MAEAEAVRLRLLARLVIAFAILMIFAGTFLHGISVGTFQRIWHDLVERPTGPLSFRFILQPFMAAIAALHDGLRDARAMRSPFAQALLQEPEQRIVRLTDALNAVDRIILLGLAMDIIYQVIALGRFYPAESVIVALLLAVVPYVVLCGLITRGARRWRRGAPAPWT